VEQNEDGNRRRKFVILLLLLLLVLLGVWSFSAGELSPVTVDVDVSDIEPADGEVTVQVLGPNGNEAASDTVNSTNGTLNFELENGVDYTLNAPGSGFSLENVSPSPFQSNNANTVTADLIEDNNRSGNSKLVRV